MKGLFLFCLPSYRFITYTMGLFDFLKKKPEPQKQEEIQALEQGLEKTSTGLFSKIGRAVVGKSKVDEDVLDELEEILLTSDVGVATTLKIIERIERLVAGPYLELFARQKRKGWDVLGNQTDKFAEVA